MFMERAEDLGQYPAVLTSRLVNHPYVLDIFVVFCCLVGPLDWYIVSGQAVAANSLEIIVNEFTSRV